MEVNANYNVSSSHSCRSFCRSENRFKFTGVMDNILEMSQFMNLSDDVLYMLDEMGDARTEASENDVTCEEMYSDCPATTIISLRQQLLSLVL